MLRLFSHDLRAAWAAGKGNSGQEFGAQRLGRELCSQLGEAPAAGGLRGATWEAEASRLQKDAVPSAFAFLSVRSRSAAGVSAGVQRAEVGGSSL